MNRVSKILSHLIWNPANFYETRYTLVPSGPPLPLGSLSLGYSNNSLKIYLTKMIGDDGCFDWNLSDLISIIRNAVTNRQFTPEFTEMIQTLSNEMVPGFGFNFANVHFCMRPKVSGIKLGISFMAVTQFSLISNNKDNISNLQYLVENYGALVPLSSFVFRRFTKVVGIGEIVADLFISVSTSSTVTVQLETKFFFDPKILTKENVQMINEFNNSHNRAAAQTINDNNQTQDTRTNNNNNNNNNNLNSNDDSKNEKNEIHNKFVNAPSDGHSQQSGNSKDNNDNNNNNDNRMESEREEENEERCETDNSNMVGQSNNSRVEKKFILVNEKGETLTKQEINKALNVGATQQPWLKQQWKVLSGAVAAFALYSAPKIPEIFNSA